MESPFNLYYKRHTVERVVKDKRLSCAFAKDIKNEDFGACVLEYENGMQGSYSQNFFARNSAARRGARLYGYKGTIQFDWYTDEVKVFYHHKSVVETVRFEGKGGHGGGDEELCYDFLMAMRDKKPSRSPISAGILSCLTCLWARESSEKKVVCEIKMP